MDKVYLRSLFESQKGFLKKLQSGEQTRRALFVANDYSLNVVIRILHLIAIGEISLPSKSSQTIKKSLRVKKLLSFESKKFFQSVLNSPRENKLKLLNQFIKLYPDLLYTFFNEV